MAAKVGMFLATYNSVTLPVGRDRKIQTALRSNQIAGFVTMPSEKKIKFVTFGLSISKSKFFFRKETLEVLKTLVELQRKNLKNQI